MIERVRRLVEDAIVRSGLPITPGVRDDDYKFGWSGRRVDGMPESFVAKVEVGIKEVDSLFSIEVYAFGYDVVSRSRGFSRLYYLDAFTAEQFVQKSDPVPDELRSSICLAWEDMPLTYQNCLEEEEEFKRFCEHLRREGLLQD